MPVARPRRRAGGRGERARREDAPRIAARHPVAGERAQEGGEEPEEGGGGRRGPARAAELLEEGGGENGGGVGGPRREEQGGKGEPETRVGERLPIGRHPAIIDNPVAVSKDSRGYMGAKYIGAGGKRREDPRPLRGRGTYVDALKLPGLLHAAVVRSPHAHARLGAIRADAALRLPGVVAVFAFDALTGWPQRHARMPMGCRGVVADPRGRDGLLTVWDSPQIPHHIQGILVGSLSLPAHRVRVIAPDVGGGVGAKATIYPEEVFIPVVASPPGRPGKWIETPRA